MNQAPTSSPRWINGIEPAPELRAMTGPQILELECRQQPTLLRNLLQTYQSDPQIQSQLHELKKIAAAKVGGGAPILFLGMGGSFAAAIPAANHLQSHARLAFPLDAGEFLHFAQPLWQNPNAAALSILLTTSGESAELLELLRQLPSPTVLLSNNLNSTAWQIAQHKLPILAGPEYGNATKTFTCSAAAAIILASELANLPWQENATRTLDTFSALLDPIFQQRTELEAFTRNATNTELIARGPTYAAAIMGALTIRELSGHRAAPHTGSAFRHGPNLDVSSSHLALIFALGPTAPLSIKLASECNKKGGKVLLITSEKIPRTDLLLPIQIPPVPSPWEPLPAILVPQALTLAMIERPNKNGAPSCILPPRFQYGHMEQ